jgi:hemerythrin superfamily protein
MPDVTELIEHDHREVETLLHRFKENGDDALASKICDELDAHAAAEEKTFYPVVRDDLPNGKKLAEEGEDEHTPRLGSSSGASGERPIPSTFASW